MPDRRCISNSFTSEYFSNVQHKSLGMSQETRLSNYFRTSSYKVNLVTSETGCSEFQNCIHYPKVDIIIMSVVLKVGPQIICSQTDYTSAAYYQLLRYILAISCQVTSIIIAFTS